MRFEVLMLALVSAGCASAPSGPNIGKLSIEYSWASVRPCSNVSPEIKVYNVPPGTARLKIELVDIDSLISNHGGGEVDYKGGTIIPAGSLKQYRGPCPVGAKAGPAVQYDLRISALDAGGSVIGYGSERKSYTAPRILPGVRL